VAKEDNGTQMQDIDDNLVERLSRLSINPQSQKVVSWLSSWFPRFIKENNYPTPTHVERYPKKLFSDNNTSDKAPVYLLCAWHIDNKKSHPVLCGDFNVTIDQDFSLVFETIIIRYPGSRLLGDWNKAYILDTQIKEVDIDLARRNTLTQIDVLHYAEVMSHKNKDGFCSTDKNTEAWLKTIFEPVFSLKEIL